ncbi:MAG: response regulator transcription factor [Proteobacteria bacterium]|nr:response regulator transcription factor [Pseudomonadota bacterium]
MGHSVYIVEDHPRMRDVLREWIAALPGLTVCGAAECAETALRELATTKADLVLVDMSLPGMDGTELVAALRERHPDIRCLILSGHDEARYVQRALAAGAQGYLLKDRPAEIEKAITTVLAGESSRGAEPGAPVTGAR